MSIVWTEKISRCLALSFCGQSDPHSAWRHLSYVAVPNGNRAMPKHHLRTVFHRALTGHMLNALKTWVFACSRKARFANFGLLHGDNMINCGAETGTTCKSLSDSGVVLRLRLKISIVDCWPQPWDCTGVSNQLPYGPQVENNSQMIFGLIPWITLEPTGDPGADDFRY